MLGKGVLLACCLLAPCAAQDSKPASRADSRQVVEYSTASGLRVRLVPVDLPGESAVLLGIRGAGMLSEPAGLPHLAHISEHGIFHSVVEGLNTGPLLEKWYAEGRANAETLADFMYFDLYPDPGDASVVKAIMIQLARFAAGWGDPSVLEVEKPRALAEITGLEANPSQTIDHLGKFAWAAFTQAAFHRKPNVAVKGGTASITSEDVNRFHDSTFNPDGAMLTIVGDFDIKQARANVDAMGFSPHLREKLAPRPSLKPGSFAGNWDVASNQFFMAWPGPAPSDAAHPALAVFAQLLNTRLAFPPEIRSLIRIPILVHADAGGLFVIQSPLKTPGGGDALAVEIRKVIDAVVGDDAALRHLRAASGSIRNNAGILRGPMQYPPNLPRKIMAHANLELARMRATLAWNQSPEEYCARADKVTADDVKAAVKTWLAPDKATIVTIAGKE